LEAAVHVRGKVSTLLQWVSMMHVPQHGNDSEPPAFHVRMLAKKRGCENGVQLPTAVDLAHTLLH
jgi:hypothetical protein